MKTFTMTHFFVCVAIMVALVYAKPATKPGQNEERNPVVSYPKDDQNEDSLMVVPLGVEIVPMVDAPTQNEDGEMLDTANARYYSDYYFRPVYSIRRTQSNRRRVYAPRRHYSDSGDRFPTVT